MSGGRAALGRDDVERGVACVEDSEKAIEDALFAVDVDPGLLASPSSNLEQPCLGRGDRRTGSGGVGGPGAVDEDSVAECEPVVLVEIGEGDLDGRDQGPTLVVRSQRSPMSRTAGWR